ncbi:MAG: hypothetical protein EB023_06840 [Flavobacteriia bacterium]|nr:hypothetical protein [Flavobacteriia bacterium]
MGRIANLLGVVFLLFCFAAFSQPDAPLRGPQNIPADGVIDGIVAKDEVPVRSDVVYEHVRLADLVWSRRLFSRIDAREKANFPLFIPYDFFPDLGWDPPKNYSELDKGDWVKNQERYSLWTIIMRHAFLGDLTIFEVANPNFTAIEDGYSLKYPIKSTVIPRPKYPYFDDAAYRKLINRKFSFGGIGPIWTIDRPSSGDTWNIMKDNAKESFEDWYTRLTTKGDSLAQDPEDYEPLTREPKELLKESYNNLATVGALRRPDVVKYISSQSISAYNIKEDWFFDKERSLLDKRIIAIAPVARVKPIEVEDPNEVNDEGIDRYKNLVCVNRNGFLEEYDKDAGTHNTYEGITEEKELFWLYFPQLRNVIVNYYVYNPQNDAQWMTFDDFFWKRLFSSQIYKATDQFNRAIEDYRQGVDRLYEAEKIKETMRTWETDLWHY